MEKVPAEPRLAAQAAIFTAAAMIAQQVAGKATRDTFFLANFDKTSVLLVTLGSAALALVVLPAASRAMTRLGPLVLMPYAFAASSLLFLAEWAMSFPWPRLSALAVYIHMSLLGAILISGFWSVVNERFDPHTAKRLIGRIAGGATLGGIVGGFWGVRAANWPVTLMLPVMAVVHLVCVIGVLALRRSSLPERAAATPPGPDAESITTLRSLRESPYLRHIALMVATVAFISVIVHYLLVSEAVDRFLGEEARLRFFSLYYGALAFLAFAFQLTLSRPALRNLGLAGTIAILPAAVLVLGGVALFVPALWVYAALRGSDDVLSNSLFRSAYELLYTPVAPEQKRASKAIIDVGFDRIGKGLGSGAAYLLVVWLAVDSRVLAGMVVAAALAALLLSTRLHQGYVAALAESLRTRALAIDDAEVVDATTRRTLSEATGNFDRTALLAAIKTRKQEDASGPFVTIDRMPRPPAAALAAPIPAASDPILGAIADLRSGDAARMRAVLKRSDPLEPGLDPELAVHIIPLLANNAVYREALKALRSIAARSQGLLLDALLDPEGDFVVRRRLPRVLKACATARVVDGLMLALADKRFEIRYRCAAVLAHLTTEHPELVPPPQAVFEAARREIEASKKVWDSQQLIEPPEDETDNIFFDEFLKQRSSRSLEHVFTVLSLALEREPLRIAFRALRTSDPNLRGTALEYLESVLPEDLRDGLWPYLGDQQGRPQARRSRQEVLSDLMSSNDSIAINLEALLRQQRGDSL